MTQRWSAIFCAMGVWGVKPIGRVRVNIICTIQNAKFSEMSLMPEQSSKKSDHANSHLFDTFLNNSCHFSIFMITPERVKNSVWRFSDLSASEGRWWPHTWPKMVESGQKRHGHEHDSKLEFSDDATRCKNLNKFGENRQTWPNLICYTKRSHQCMHGNQIG